MPNLIRALTIFLALVYAVCGIAGTQETVEDRPNILFIAIDDLKPLTTHYGNQKVITPTLDRLASQSTVFTKAYTQYPVCGPSRTSLLTGVRPESNGVLDLKTRMRDINPDIVTLPQFFKNNGYQTAAAGKIFDPRNVDSRDDDDPASWTIAYKQSHTEADKKLKDNFIARSIEGYCVVEENGRGFTTILPGRGLQETTLPICRSKQVFRSV